MCETEWMSKLQVVAKKMAKTNTNGTNATATAANIIVFIYPENAIVSIMFDFLNMIQYYLKNEKQYSIMILSISYTTTWCILGLFKHWYQHCH